MLEKNERKFEVLKFNYFKRKNDKGIDNTERYGLHGATGR